MASTSGCPEGSSNTACLECIPLLKSNFSLKAFYLSVAPLLPQSTRPNISHLTFSSPLIRKLGLNKQPCILQLFIGYHPYDGHWRYKDK